MDAWRGNVDHSLLVPDAALMSMFSIFDSAQAPVEDGHSSSTWTLEVRMVVAW